ncbi:MAG TPA: thiolase family protein [Candidatus Acidoferrales bacterium]|nr:thiolase family protein [Candidatus Acidoferrales bacterium]
MMANEKNGIFIAYDDIWLLDGVRTPFVDYTGALGLVSPTDLGIKAARGVFERAKISPTDVGAVIAGSVAQASFDAYVLPRHIGLYSGVPLDRPALLVQRVCGTGIEAIGQAADAIRLKKIELGLCVGAESMSRNPIAAYTHRSGFRMGQVEFKDFLWEALLDPAADVTMGDTAETIAREYKITREDVDRFAELSFSRALAAQTTCFLSGEIVPVVSETFELSGYKPRGIRLPKGVENLAVDTHIRASSYETLAKIRPAFGGVQTGGNSSAIVDGAAAALVGSGSYAQSREKKPLARIVAVATVGVPPEIMSIGPAPAIRRLLDGVGLSLDAIDRFEINEAFAAQVIGVERELKLDRGKLNVNGGAIAIGHPLAATGIRLAVTLARELERSEKRYGIASACIGGGQGIAMLLENPR